MSKLALLICTFALLFGSGCASTSLEHRNLSLSRKALKRGGLAVVAVTALGGGEYAGSVDVATSLQHELKRKRRSVPLVTLDEVRQTFSPAEYTALLKRASEAGNWTPELLAGFDALTNRARFGMVIDIREAGERNWRFEQQDFADWLGDAILTSIDKDYEPCESDKQYVTVAGVTRKVGVLFAVYDLRTKEAVWAGYGRTRLRDSVSNPSDSAAAETAKPETPSAADGVARMTEAVVRYLGE